MAAVLGGVNRRHQRQAVQVLERGSGVGHQPVVGMDHIGGVTAEIGLGPVEEPHVEGQHPRHQVLERDPRRVLLDPNHPDPFPLLLRRRIRMGPCVHGHPVTGPGQAVSEPVDVASEPADHGGRVLPGEQHDRQGRHRLAANRTRRPGPAARWWRR
jgi:hypothetical protein